jgi:hypothetical protein
MRLLINAPAYEIKQTFHVSWRGLALVPSEPARGDCGNSPTAVRLHPRLAAVMRGCRNIWYAIFLWSADAAAILARLE